MSKSSVTTEQHEAKVYAGKSDVAVGVIMTESGDQVNIHKLSLVFLEAMGRLDRELRKNGVSVTDANRIHLSMQVEVEV